MKQYFCLTMLIAAAMFLVSCGDKRTEQGTEAVSQTGTGELSSTENGQQEETEEKLTVTEDGYIVVDHIFLEMDKVDLRKAYIDALGLPEDTGYGRFYFPGNPFRYICVQSTEIPLDESWTKAREEAQAYYQYDLLNELTMPFLEEICSKYGVDPSYADTFIGSEMLYPTITINALDRETIKKMLTDKTIRLFIDAFTMLIC